MSNKFVMGEGENVHDNLVSQYGWRDSSPKNEKLLTLISFQPIHNRPTFAVEYRRNFEESCVERNRPNFKSL